MNCERIKQQILLNQAGELSEGELLDLVSHLGACESCRKYSEQSGAILALAKSSLPLEDPSPAVMANILKVAREEVDHKTVLFELPSLRWVACAAAALLLICWVGVWSFSVSSVSSASHISAIVMAVGSEENMQVMSQSGKAEKDQELQALASHLLLMEGFITDEVPEAEIIDVSDEPQPTALQLHSIDVFELQRCV